MNILIISHGIDGGINRVSSDLHNSLSTHTDIRSHIVRVGNKREPIGSYVELDEKNIILKGGSGKLSRTVSWLVAVFELLRYIRGKKFDVVIFSGILPAIFFSRIMKRKHNKCFLWEHGPQKTHLNSKKLMCLFIPGLDGVVSPTASSLRWFCKNLGVKALSYGVVENWINHEMIVVKSNLDNRSNFLRIFVSARIDFKQKDFVTLVEALCTLKNKKEIEFIVDIYGQGEDKELLQGLILEKELQSHVTLKGHVNNIYEVMCSYDLSILPTKWEGFGLSIAESMAAKVTPISASVEGAVDVIVDRFDGFLYTPESQESLVQCIEEYFSMRPEAKVAMSEAGYLKVIGQYNPKVQLSKIVDFFTR